MPIPAGYAIDAQLQSMPLVGVLAGHLRAHAGAGVDVLASGEVGGVEKVYAAARVMLDEPAAAEQCRLLGATVTLGRLLRISRARSWDEWA